jgi:hypothetical protein
MNKKEWSNQTKKDEVGVIKYIDTEKQILEIICLDQI